MKNTNRTVDEARGAVVPVLERALSLLRVDDPRVAAIGACNTVLFEETGPSGFNTDHSGFITAYRTTFPGGSLASSQWPVLEGWARQSASPWPIWKPARFDCSIGIAPKRKS
ncbi:MAG: hypothetical protein ACFCUR_05245 [Rhodomicrobiaceae bacterium]